MSDIEKALFYAGLPFIRKCKSWLFYRISKTSVSKMHRKNEILQNACFPVLQKWVHFRYSIYARYNRRGYVMPISFLAGNFQQAHIAADYLLYNMMNAYSVSVCHMRR